MDITQYVTSMREGVRNAAALGDDHTRQVAERLGVSVESMSRLALLQALADAAAEISVELAPGSVEVRMSGAEPVFVVALPPAEDIDDVTVLQTEDSAPPAAEGGDPDDQQARVSLRMPQSVKEKVDEYADAEGISTNTWLLHRVLEGLAERTRRGSRRKMGWGINIGNDGVQVNVPPSVPVPPEPPVFRGGFLFGEDEDADGSRRRPNRGRAGRREGGTGPVQGWVR
jgi:Arc-like DNA binding domain